MINPNTARSFSVADLQEKGDDRISALDTQSLIHKTVALTTKVRLIGLNAKRLMIPETRPKIPG